MDNIHVPVEVLADNISATLQLVLNSFRIDLKEYFSTDSLRGGGCLHIAGRRSNLDIVHLLLCFNTGVNAQDMYYCCQHPVYHGDMYTACTMPQVYRVDYMYILQ